MCPCMLLLDWRHYRDWHLCSDFDAAEVSCAMRMQTYAAHTLFDMNRTVQQNDPAWCIKAGNRNVLSVSPQEAPVKTYPWEESTLWPDRFTGRVLYSDISDLLS